jgi:hypothetical protein
MLLAATLEGLLLDRELEPRDFDIGEAMKLTRDVLAKKLAALEVAI